MNRVEGLRLAQQILKRRLSLIENDALADEKLSRWGTQLALWVTELAHDEDMLKSLINYGNEGV
jgi:hypothetical protein